MSWTLEPASAFDAHAAAWGALNREQGGHLLWDPDFVRPLIQHFGSPRTKLAVSKTPGARGYALIETGRLGFASTFQPSQSPVGLILLESPPSALASARGLIRSLPGWALSLAVLQQDPDHPAFRIAEDDPTIERVDYIDTGRLRLEGTFESYWQGRSKNLTHNLTRQRKRVAEAGRSLRLRVLEDPAMADEAITTYGRLEGSGWKAEAGTAVSMDNAQGLFYRDVMRTFMARGEGAVYQLELDGQVIASDLCLMRGDTMVILKTAYDASVEKLSAGLLLHQDIFEHAYTQGRVRVVEFYGRAREWHHKWTDEFRQMYHVNLYRNGWVAAALRMARRGRRPEAPAPATGVPESSSKAG